MADKSGASTVWWWVGWILLTIVSFFISCAFWTPFIAGHFGSMDKSGASVLWVAAVFGSWMVLLVPLIVVMYHKVDKAYEDARIAREKAAVEKGKTETRVQSVLIDPVDRLLDKKLVDKLRCVPESIKKGHLVTATLRDGRKIDHVFVKDKKEVLGVYGMSRIDFKIGDIIDLEPADLDRLPAFKAEEWLRLDGVC
ncbi:MAG: hypothetical protein HYZ52_02250 [Candidatus Omnitrophica bacterium]|nr:hypothetical protein [Candidatus Omnitrophota bacterium]